ncbi:MAG: GNAT family N-acetyltransferase [Bacteroidota bacterium]
MIEIIEEKEYWDDFVSTCKESDFYHTFDYHMIAKGDGKPVLLKYSKGKSVIALPLLIRKIQNTPYYDATSVYGYPGPLCQNIEGGFDSQKYATELLNYFSKNNIISVFSRLNPFIALQQEVLEKIGGIEKKGVVISIDLKKDIEQQRQDFGRRLKGQLNRIRRHCYATKANNAQEFRDFKNLYRENMDRVNAKPMYYFDDEYFNVLTESNSFNTHTLLTKHKETDETIGACMFIYKNATVHYHLSGTRGDSLPLMPIKLLIDEMRIMANELGLSHFNLGGGLGGANDSLLQFKSSFSKNMVDFCVWKLVVNPIAYQKLVAERNIPETVNFFPLYRYDGELLLVKNGC